VSCGRRFLGIQCSIFSWTGPKVNAKCRVTIYMAVHRCSPPGWENANKGYVGPVDIHQFAAGEAGARRDVDQSPADPASTMPVTPSCSAILGAAGVSVDINQPRSDYLPTRIDGVDSIADDVGFD
jgi:hypothetical protein